MYKTFVVALAAGFLSQAPTIAPPLDGARLLIDNPRVAVWETVWTKGHVVPVHRYQGDTVLVPIGDISLTITGQDGKSRTLSLKIGDMILWPDGTTQSEVAGTDGRIIMTRLKDIKVPPFPNPTKYGLAFPRARAKKLIETDRITGWDYTWRPGEPTPMHFHDKDVVLTYVGAGALNSTTPDGAVALNEFKFGETRFNPGNRVHFESWVRGDQPRAIIMELK